MTIPVGTPINAPKVVNSDLAKWLLHGLNDLIKDTQSRLESHRLSDVADNLKSFFWGNFCDWYLEMDKNPNRTLEDNQVIAFAFTTLIKMLHLYVPFVTEALWREFKQPKMLAVSEWPQPLPYQFKASHQRIEIVKESISQIRVLREKANIGLEIMIPATLCSKANASIFSEHQNLIIRLARLKELNISEKEPDVAKDLFGAYFHETFASIDATFVDWKKEIQTLQKKFKSESDFVEKSRNKLDNPGFQSNAPEKVVTDLKQKIIDTEKTLKALKQQIRDLEKLAS